ncbi:MAG: type II toxin-antitoxin system VapC family toxin [Bacteroidetes bacterium]|nr:type II toxin-antitoxin system VapC family toxin [Bacteroidota bacterium]MBU1760408.1 type II toxin-antitoxin system VapC family toxin [Bacteroidota bacterium]
MADEKLMVDSTILIDYFRKTDKANSRLVAHFRNYESLYISSVTEFEVVNGATKEHLQFWDGMLARFTILDFDSKAARQAADIVAQLKTKRKTIDKPDLFIAATALVNNLTLDTLNIKHFSHIEDLNLLTR